MFVPQSRSLDVAPLTRLDVENHIVAAAGAPGQFTTLSGKMLVVGGAAAHTLDGFSQRLSIPILATENVVRACVRACVCVRCVCVRACVCV